MVTHLINTPITLWLAPITAESHNLHLGFIYLVTWSIVEVVAGPGAARLGKALDPVDILTVPLILPIITVGVNVTLKKGSQTGLSPLHKAREEGRWAGAILW